MPLRGAQPQICFHQAMLMKKRTLGGFVCNRCVGSDSEVVVSVRAHVFQFSRGVNDVHIRKRTDTTFPYIQRSFWECIRVTNAPRAVPTQRFTWWEYIVDDVCSFVRSTANSCNGFRLNTVF